MAFAAELSVHCGGAYQYEVELKNECLLCVGWAALEGRRALGTAERSVGYGGTGTAANLSNLVCKDVQHCKNHIWIHSCCTAWQLEGRAKQIMT